jgi:hypothetical protein
VVRGGLAGRGDRKIVGLREGARHARLAAAYEAQLHPAALAITCLKRV